MLMHACICTLCTCMYVRTCILMRMCACIVCILMCVYERIYNEWTCMNVPIKYAFHMHLWYNKICLYVCTYAFMCVCMCVCMRVYMRWSVRAHLITWLLEYKSLRKLVNLPLLFVAKLEVVAMLQGWEGLWQFCKAELRGGICCSFKRRLLVRS